MNKKQPRQLDGSGWQQMTQIVEFHETRLNRLDSFAKETLSKTGDGDGGMVEWRKEYKRWRNILRLLCLQLKKRPKPYRI